MLKIWVIVLFLVFVWTNTVQAGFGISNARVWNEKLVPGTHYEHLITLTRSKPTEPVKITVEINAPEIKDWVTIAEGSEFIYPAGLQQFPMTVLIDVPEDAGYGTYRGKMTIKASPTGREGQVTVALGAVADFLLRVSGDVFSDFRIRSIEIPDLEEGWPIIFNVNLENLGNIKVRPSKVKLSIFDNYHQNRVAGANVLSVLVVYR